MSLFFLFSSVNIHAKSPNIFSIEAFVTTVDSNGKKTPLKGNFQLKFELVKSDGTVLFEKSSTIIVTMGRLTLDINYDDNFDSTIFTNNLLNARITLQDLIM
ncbi:MAG: hypothetical protein VW397_08775, partial [Candidatus Margulisiibacteriota bacterium]